MTYPTQHPPVDAGDEVAKLLIAESTDSGDLKGAVIPWRLMEVTNRDIASGKLSPTDPLRQLATGLVGDPYLAYLASHITIAARDTAQQTMEEIHGYFKALKEVDIDEVREKVKQGFDAAVTIEQHGTVLALFTVTMKAVERNLVERNQPAELVQKFADAHAYEYKSYVYQEAMVGLESPGGADVSVEALMAITSREIGACRMTEDHSARQTAVKCAAAPYMTHIELVERHAAIKADGAGATPPVGSPTRAKSSGSASYALGKTIGKTLKSLFRK